jgi:hypothetical protein
MTVNKAFQQHRRVVHLLDDKPTRQISMLCMGGRQYYTANGGIIGRIKVMAVISKG